MSDCVLFAAGSQKLRTVACEGSEARLQCGKIIWFVCVCLFGPDNLQRLLSARRRSCYICGQSHLWTRRPEDVLRWATRSAVTERPMRQELRQPSIHPFTQTISSTQAPWAVGASLWRSPEQRQGRVWTGQPSVSRQHLRESW